MGSLYFNLYSCIMKTKECNIDIYVDASVYNHPDNNTIGVGLVAFNDLLTPIAKAECYQGRGTNNMGEWIALIHGIQFGITQATLFDVESIIIHSDSQLVVNTMLGEYKLRAKNLIPYYKKAQIILKELEDLADTVLIEWLQREHPRMQYVDKLSKSANPHFQKELL